MQKLRSLRLLILVVMALGQFPLFVQAQTENATKIDALLTNADTMKRDGRPAEALVLVQTALELQQKEVTVPNKKTAQILRKLGTLALDSRKLVEATQYLEESLRVLIKIGEGQSSDASLCYLDLGLVANQRSDYAAQIANVRKSIDIQTKITGADSTTTASALMILASSLRNIGQHAESLKLNRQALEIRQKKFGSQAVEVAAVHIDVSTDLLNLQEYEEAGRQVDLALKILRQYKKNSWELANAYEMRGLVDSRLDNYEAAVKNLQLAINTYEAVEPGSQRIASALIHQGQAYRLSGQLDPALKCFKSAKDLYGKRRGATDPTVAVALYGIAEVSFLKQDLPAALAACDEARRITRDNFVNVLPFLSEREQLRFIEDEDTQRFAQILSASQLMHEDDTVAALSAEWTINSKGVAQESLTEQNRMLAQLANSPRKNEVEELVRIRQQIAQLALAKPEDQSAYQQQLDDMTDRAEKLTRELVSGGLLTADRDAWVDVDEVRGSLAQSTYIVQFARFRQFLFDAQSNWGEQNYVAWIIPPRGVDKIRMIDLGPAAPIDRLITDLRKELALAAKPDGSIKKLGEEAAAKQITPNLAKLRKIIFAPIAPHVRKANKLVLSPDSSLWLAPWPALPGDDASKFLIEQFTLSFVISPSQLMANPKQAADLQPPVIFADPKFDLNPDDVWQSIRDILRAQAPSDAERTRSVQSFTNRSFANVAPLPGTATEAALIAPVLESYTGKKAQQYLDRFALETIARALNRPSVLVFGTHGFFSGEELPQSATASIAYNPLARCGLLMAGCKAKNAGTRTAGDDGILTGMEIASLNLHETELVILSACETAVGTPRVGEGVASLCQAFQLAGARSVVASLWAVPDRESALLINKFVEELEGGKTKAEAMRAAQLDRIERRRERFGAAHPFFWSAFTVNGN